MENNALAIEKIQGNENESSPLPGNTRSSLNGIKSSCTLRGRRRREGKQQLVGDTAGEGDTAAWQAGNCGEGTSPEGCSSCPVSCGIPEGAFFPELP